MVSWDWGRRQGGVEQCQDIPSSSLAEAAGLWRPMKCGTQAARKSLLESGLDSDDHSS